VGVMSLLMVSRMPTLSIKHIHIPRTLRPAIAAFVGLLLCAAILWPWATMTVALLVYLAAIPAGVAARDRHFDRID